MVEARLKTARLVSVAAATVISLACGTNYIYSAWAPQFAEKLKLSATESNLIGTFGNLGMYASGIPLGYLVDTKGPRPGVLLGCLCLGLGYYPLNRAYLSEAGSVSVAALCFFSLLTGIGSCAAFSAALKSAALNWPEHRGTATAFPLAAFGLSAFFFALIQNFAFHEDTAKFLLLLSIGTFSLVFVPQFFLRVYPHPALYSSLPIHEPPSITDSQQLHRTKSEEYIRHEPEPGRQSDSKASETVEIASTSLSSELEEDGAAPEILSARDTDETASLLSKSSSSGPGDISFINRGSATDSDDINNSHHLDIRGFALLPRIEFWQLFLMMGILTGIGLMTINNIGNDAKALWKHWDDSATPAFIQQRQLIHVSLLSLLSFGGRLLSGVGSDLLVKHLHMSRLWCLFISTFIFLAAQICGSKIENPHFLVFVSGLTGLAYGFLFGVLPSIISHTFGVHGLSQNWGTMTIAPVIAGNFFNLIYGAIYDAHSTKLGGGERVCEEGLNCYATAYNITAASSIVGLLVVLWGIWHENKVKEAEKMEQREHEG